MSAAWPVRLLSIVYRVPGLVGPAVFGVRKETSRPGLETRPDWSRTATAIR